MNKPHKNKHKDTENSGCQRGKGGWGVKDKAITAWRWIKKLNLWG